MKPTILVESQRSSGDHMHSSQRKNIINFNKKVTMNKFIRKHLVAKNDNKTSEEIKYNRVKPKIMFQM